MTVITISIVLLFFFLTHTCHSTLYFADLPYNLLVNGKFNQTVPAMIGVTRNEGGFFVLPVKGKDIVYDQIPVFPPISPHFDVICDLQHETYLFYIHLWVLPQ